jgi:hypothetical protein
MGLNLAPNRIGTNIVQLHIYIDEPKEKLFYDSRLGVGNCKCVHHRSTNNNEEHHHKKKTWALTILHLIWGGGGGVGG